MWIVEKKEPVNWNKNGTKMVSRYDHFKIDIPVDDEEKDGWHGIEVNEPVDITDDFMKIMEPTGYNLSKKPEIVFKLYDFSKVTVEELMKNKQWSFVLKNDTIISGTIYSVDILRKEIQIAENDIDIEFDKIKGYLKKE